MALQAVLYIYDFFLSTKCWHIVQYIFLSSRFLIYFTYDFNVAL